MECRGSSSNSGTSSTSSNSNRTTDISLQDGIVDILGTNDEDARGSDVVSALVVGCSQSLNLTRTYQLSQLIKQDPFAYRKTSFAPEMILTLIAHNRTIAIDLIASQPTFDDYIVFLRPLLNVPVVGDHLEVISSVASRRPLSSDFLISYIDYCLRHCEQIREPAAKDKIVRLVCQFCITIHSYYAQLLNELSVQLLTFCVSNAHIKEATVLYGAIKMG